MVTASDDWDIFVVADGSGGEKGACPVGWYALVLHKATKSVYPVCGAACPTNCVAAELLPFAFALPWCVSKFGRKLKKPLKVSCLTDCDNVYKAGRKRNGHLRKGERQPMWLAIENAREAGLQIRWHWSARNSCMPQRVCDERARNAKEALKATLM